MQVSFSSEAYLHEKIYKDNDIESYPDFNLHRSIAHNNNYRRSFNNDIARASDSFACAAESVPTKFAWLSRKINFRELPAHPALANYVASTNVSNLLMMRCIMRR